MNRFFVVCLFAGCGGSHGASVDAAFDAPQDVPADAGPPLPLGGGGMNGGPIAGQVAVYVIDDLTRTPVPGATVVAGGMTGTTDAAGRVVISGVTGPQTILATATGHVAQLWVGASAQDVTIDLEPDPVASPTLPYDVVTFPAMKSGNYLAQPRASQLELGLATYTPDPPLVGTDPNGTPPVHWPRIDDALGMGPLRTMASVIAVVYPSSGAYVPAQVGLASGAAANGFVQLQSIDASALVAATIDYGTLPAGLTLSQGLVGLERADGILPMNEGIAPTTQSVLPLAMYPGATYALTARAEDSGAPLLSSVVLRHGITTPAMTVDAWLDPPTSVDATQTAVSWTPSVPGAIYAIDVFDPMSPAAQRVLQIRVLDGSATVAIPAGTLPAMALRARVTAIEGSFDLTDLELDRDRSKIRAMASRDADLM